MTSRRCQTVTWGPTWKDGIKTNIKTSNKYSQIWLTEISNTMKRYRLLTSHYIKCWLKISITVRTLQLCNVHILCWNKLPHNHFFYLFSFVKLKLISKAHKQKAVGLWCDLKILHGLPFCINFKTLWLVSIKYKNMLYIKLINGKLIKFSWIKLTTVHSKVNICYFPFVIKL